MLIYTLNENSELFVKMALSIKICSHNIKSAESACYPADLSFTAFAAVLSFLLAPPAAHRYQGRKDSAAGNKCNGAAIACLRGIQLTGGHIKGEYRRPDGFAAICDNAAIPVSILFVCYVPYGKAGACCALYLYEAASVALVDVPLAGFIAAQLHLKGNILAGAHRHALAAEVILSAAVV